MIACTLSFTAARCNSSPLYYVIGTRISKLQVISSSLDTLLIIPYSDGHRYGSHRFSFLN